MQDKSAKNFKLTAAEIESLRDEMKTAGKWLRKKFQETRKSQEKPK